ncbi:uncharacterized protein HaLaN_11968 [Haematococcus lacustris]|uniref:VTT domain-containing protein n=1 Tax=Haematococcus lacustris TaxID=44745 RepID=A0A699ZA30_HAELA|nr:uncharacterized protein HaLaN_11968 [Haematococcus lacustris]
MAMAFLLARAFLKPYILRFMNRYRYTQAVLLSIRKAGAFKTVLVLRLSPVPYTIINVVMAVPENVGFATFMVASVIGKQPELVVGVIFGRNLQGIADMLRGESLPASQLAVNLVSLFAALLFLGAGFCSSSHHCQV